MDDCLCLCGLLKNAASCCDRHMNIAVDDIGISHCQAQVLMHISSKGSVSMTTLSKQLCCHKSNVTQIVDVLAKRGFIERVASKADKRVFALRLKPKGKTLLSIAEKMLRKHAKESLSMFTEPERKQLEKLLKKYVDRHASHP